MRYVLGELVVAVFNIQFPGAFYLGLKINLCRRVIPYLHRGQRRPFAGFGDYALYFLFDFLFNPLGYGFSF